MQLSVDATDFFLNKNLQNDLYKMTLLIGEVLKSLVKNGFGENTIVTLIGDHGWMLGENQEWSKYSNYRMASRVPWLLHNPKQYLNPN
jgi:membrane-anchored protein YejM (alkaline phosphatase superfamily)